jgi:hypothetical protein
MSQNLSREDSLTAKFWAYESLDPEVAPEYDDVSHPANIANSNNSIEKTFAAGSGGFILQTGHCNERCRHIMCKNKVSL